jgi:hypothetical protein
MSWKKRQFVNEAFVQLGLANYTFDLQSEQLQTGLRLLDGMMSSWNSSGLALSYPVPTTPENSDLDDETNVPDRANEAIYLNLALRLAPAFGKNVMPETRQFAYKAYQRLLSWSAMPDEMGFPRTLPSGQGNKTWRWDDRFIDQNADPYPPWNT